MSNQSQIVLLVDRDEGLLDSLRRLFENDGYRVVVATSGDSALSACLQPPGSVRFLVTDVAIGGVNGFDLAIGIATTHTHVTVVFTAPPPSSLHHTKCDVCRHAAAHFLPKIFAYSQLRDKLGQLSAETECITLEWLLHFYDEPAKRKPQQRSLAGEESEKIHTVKLHLEAVERQDVLMVQGLMEQANGGYGSCTIEPQIRTQRSWRGLRLRDLAYLDDRVMRLVVRPSPEDQIEDRSRQKKPSTSGAIALVQTGSSLSGSAPQRPEPEPIVPLAQLQKEAILSALTLLNGDKLRAAAELGIGKSTLYKKLREFGIPV